MPEEFSRTTARKRINLGTSYVDVPVITKISFIDASDRYQEWQYTIDNSSRSDRLVHTDVITGTSSDISLAVERVDTWKTLDSSDRGQEVHLSLDNVTGSNSVPPHFSAHLQTHVVRYKNPNDASVWIDSELIDSFSVVDPLDRNQETIFTLQNPMTDNAAQANPNDPDISDSGNGIDPSWRTDPFQNLINLNADTSGIVEQIFVFRRYADTCAEANLGVAQHTGGGDWYPVDRSAWIAWEQMGQTEPAAFDLSTANVGSSILRMSTIATRTLLSHLINACILTSEQRNEAPNPNTDGQNGWNPWFAWLTYSGQPSLSCDPGLIDPMPVNQPNASNTSHIINGNPHWIYLGVVGYASVDDVGSAGPEIPTGIPPFVPPT